MKKIATILAISTFLLVACTDFKDIKVSELNDKQRATTHKEFTSDENHLLQNYFKRKGDGSLTVSQAISSQKKWEDDRAQAEAKMKEDAKKAEEDKIAAQKIADEASKVINQLVTLQVTAKDNQTIDVKRSPVPHNIFYFDAKNNSNKDISKYRVTMTITNVDNQVLNKVMLERNTPIGSQQSIRDSFALESSRSNMADVFIEQHELDSLKFSFDFNIIYFTDGTKMEILK